MTRFKGIALITIGSILWGLTGPIMEWIFKVTDISVPFLLTIRLILAGILLLTFLLAMKKDIFTVWKSSSSRIQLIFFSVVGVLGLQYTFLAAINESNAVVATLFQFSAPIIIAIYLAITERKLPPKNQVIGIIGTLIGLFLLLTNGSFDSLVVSTKALIFGIALGFVFVFYTLYPAHLMREWGVLIVLGWGMLIGGIVVGAVNQVWNSNGWLFLGQTNIALMIIVLVVFGTLAFAFFLTSLKYISAVETTILTSIEPLTVMLVSVAWFGMMLESVQLVGVALMFIFVTWLSIAGDNKK